MSSKPSTLVLATTNPGKAVEFRALLEPLSDGLNVRVATPTELGLVLTPVEETGETFTENAHIKAVALATATGFPSLADDSGLCVDALGGEPGLHSARWAGANITDAQRTQLLLDRMVNVPRAQRTARFICATTLAVPNGEVVTTEGICEGLVADGLQGTQGFGYDPIFLLPDQGKTMAELSSDVKNRISHRAKALMLLGPHLRSLYASLGSS
jgi:XTP/dITP diphosphohydrolase